MKFALIQRPSTSTLRILERKITDPELKERVTTTRVEALGICQGSVLEALVASDVAHKAANVGVGEINGSCPQHITCIAVVGDTGAVQAAMRAVEAAMDPQKK